MTAWAVRARWAGVLALASLGLGLAAGYVRWGRPLALMQREIDIAIQLARHPDVTALRDARPAAVVDLLHPDGVALVRGEWRFTEMPRDRSSPRTPRDLPRHGWTPVPAAETDAHRGGGPDRFRWYRIDITLPESVGSVDVTAAAVLLECVVTGHAQIWVNDRLSQVLGENGGTLISGSSPKRLVLTHDARVGQRFELTVLGVDTVLRAPSAGGFRLRSVTLDLVRPPEPHSGRVGTVASLQPALRAIVSPQARLEKVVDGLQSVEGPLWMPAGYLLFSDFGANLIYRWAPDDGLTIFRTKSGYAGVDMVEHRLPGSNGLAVDREGRLTIAEHGRRRVTRLEQNGDLTVLAAAYDGRRLNSPNDLVYKSNGALYFTDPPFGLPKGYGDRRRELPYSGVFRWFCGRLDLLAQDLAGPNGLAFSPDERYLYVADWSTRSVRRYEVRDDGTLANGRMFFREKADGLKVDRQGNVYAAGDGGIWVISPSGHALGRLLLPGSPTNLAWGDPDFRALYITAGTAVYRIRLEVPGVA